MRRADRSVAVGGLVRRGIVFTLLTAAIALLVGLVAPVGQRAEPGSGWGDEAASAVQQGLQSISPIALANACGLGASSCFKCHNGKRAAEPSTDPVKGPWHAHHRKVNNSCVGCHKGNPRIMVKETSHADLVKSPRSAEACAGCHKTDLAKIEGAYKSNRGEK